MKTLKQIRAEWEKGLEPLAVLDRIKENGTVLVVLEKRPAAPYSDDLAIYHCHRYISLGGINWDCSVDRQATDARGAFKWLENPRAKQ